MAKILFVTLEPQAFLNQRLSLANGLRDAGHEIHLATTATHPAASPLAGAAPTACSQIESLGFPIHSIPLNRKGKNLLTELSVVLAISRMIKVARPDVILGFALKPSLYSSLATLCMFPRYRPRVIGTITGLGYVYTENTPPVRTIRMVVNVLFAFLARTTRTVFAFQNDDDRAYFRGILPASSSVRVPGSGIDCNFFSPALAPRTQADTENPIVLFPARMLRHKGVFELLAAIPLVKSKFPSVRFLFLGSPDPSNPASVPEAEFQRLISDGTLDWVPTVPRSETVEYYRRATLVCLPSYREGLPMALMEAAACGTPLVATDVPGCREVCLDGVTGRLVPVGDSLSLARAINSLLGDPVEREEFGRRARNLIMEKFSVECVVRRYKELMDQRNNCGRDCPV